MFFPNFFQKPYADYDYLLKVLYYQNRQITLQLCKLENISVSNSDEITVLQIIRLKLDSWRNILCHNITKINSQHRKKIKGLYDWCNYFFCHSLGCTQSPLDHHSLSHLMLAIHLFMLFYTLHFMVISCLIKFDKPHSKILPKFTFAKVPSKWFLILWTIKDVYFMDHGPSRLLTL